MGSSGFLQVCIQSATPGTPLRIIGSEMLYTSHFDNKADYNGYSFTVRQAPKSTGFGASTSYDYDYVELDYIKITGNSDTGSYTWSKANAFLLRNQPLIGIKGNGTTQANYTFTVYSFDPILV